MWWFTAFCASSAIGVTAVVNRKVRGLVKSLTGTKLFTKPVSRAKQTKDALLTLAAYFVFFTMCALICILGPYPVSVDWIFTMRNLEVISFAS